MLCDQSRGELRQLPFLSNVAIHRQMPGWAQPSGPPNALISGPERVSRSYLLTRHTRGGIAGREKSVLRCTTNFRSAKFAEQENYATQSFPQRSKHQRRFFESDTRGSAAQKESVPQPQKYPPDRSGQDCQGAQNSGADSVALPGLYAPPALPINAEQHYAGT